MNMKKTRTTYGVYNMVEWQAILRMGKATVRVPFTGGSITTQGVTPATFTTDNPVIQFAIERSAAFLTGKIKVVRRVDLKGVVEMGRNSAKHAPMAIPEEQEGRVEDGTASISDGSDPSDESDISDLSDPSDVADGSDVSDNGGVVTQLEFECNDDARDYLVERYGFVRSKLTTQAKIIAAGKTHGLDITFV